MTGIKNYRKYRDKMQNGDVIAFHGEDIGSKVIQKFTKSKYSHVGLVIKLLEVDVKRVFIAESIPTGGVVLLPLSRKLLNYDGSAWWLALDTKRDMRNKMLKWAMTQLGKKYDFTLIKYIATNILLKKKLPQENYHEYICSEFVAAALSYAGILGDKTTNLIPEDIVRLPVLKEPVSIL